MAFYKVSLTTKLDVRSLGRASGRSILAIEPEDYTKDEVEAFRAAGYTVLGYLSVGSVSDQRPYYPKLKKYCLKRLKDWPHERYLDLRQEKARDWCVSRAAEIRKKGFDGWWLDNIDVYEEYRSMEMFNGLTFVLQGIKALGGYVMLNGGIAYLTDLMVPHKVQLGAYRLKANANRMKKALERKGFPAAAIEMDGLRKVQSGAFASVSMADQLVEKLRSAGFDTAKRISMFYGQASSIIDGVTQEEVFSLITSYSGKGAFGKQDKKESERYQGHLLRCGENGIEAFLLEYTRDGALKRLIIVFCEQNGMSACISGDVDL